MLLYVKSYIKLKIEMEDILRHFIFAVFKMHEIMTSIELCNFVNPNKHLQKKKTFFRTSVCLVSQACRLSILYLKANIQMYRGISFSFNVSLFKNYSVFFHFLLLLVFITCLTQVLLKGLVSPLCKVRKVNSLSEILLLSKYISDKCS